MTISPQKFYDILLESFGPQHWWPVDTKYHQHHHSDPRFEIMVGAILTQNTAWTNVEKALHNLRSNKALTIHKMATINITSLKTMIQPSGFFNQKAYRLKLFSAYIEKSYDGDLHKFFSREKTVIRRELLSLQGIGPETADSILLYAGDHAFFVVDSYTKRICQRLPFHVASNSYDDIQAFFEKELQLTLQQEKLVSTYKEFHALVVKLAKHHCWKKKPHCTRCPLTTLCKKLL
ncbi:MAG: endonuclease [Candidatus Thermoplasmatota archaeon]|nr:endonuclease [Candidatus Thermoplasmatota archaeon]